MSDARTALCRFFDADDSLLYIGIAADPDHRQTQHARDAADTWYPLMATRTVEWFDTREEAGAAERAALATERPRFNMAHSPHRGPETWAAHRNRQRKKERDRTVKVPVGRPADAARSSRTP
jgi:hypothetical protein